MNKTKPVQNQNFLLKGCAKCRSTHADLVVKCRDCGAPAFVRMDDFYGSLTNWLDQRYELKSQTKVPEKTAKAGPYTDFDALLRDFGLVYLLQVFGEQLIKHPEDANLDSSLKYLFEKVTSKPVAADWITPGKRKEIGEKFMEISGQIAKEALARKKLS